MDLTEIRDAIVTPALHITGLGGTDADALMLCTGYQETRYSALRQRSGPALGPWQVEPATHKDICRELKRTDHKTLCESITSACYMTCLPLTDDILIWNWRYSLLIARMVYYRTPSKLPSCKDVEAMAAYYVKHYNAGGKAQLPNVITVFKKVLDECKF